MNRPMDDVLKEELEDLLQRDMRRSLREVSTPQGREVSVDGRKVLNFCSNDYLGLAADERLTQAVQETIAVRGWGAGASRLVCGNFSEHAALEKELADYKKTEASLVFASGYAANVGIISSLVGRGDTVFSDRLNHASIVDGIILSRAEMKRYPHGDIAALKEMLASTSGQGRKLIVTDTVFSMDGDVAPLRDIVELAERFGAWVMVDEAHSFGLFGVTGAGLVEELGLSGRIQIQMGTLSKAAGSMGAYAAGSKELISYLINSARSLIYSTAMPPAVAAASLAALKVMRLDPQRRIRLFSLAAKFRGGLKELGLSVPEGRGPIIPVMAGEAERAVRWSRALLEEGVFVPAIRPPTVPAGTARLRVTVTAAHTDEDIDRCLAALRKVVGHG